MSPTLLLWMVGMVLHNQGLQDYQEGRLAEAAHNFRRALEIRETGQTLSSFAAVYATWGRYTEAERLGRRALALEETVPTLDNLALISLHLGRKKAAVKLTERADRVAPPTARHLAQQGTVYAKVGRWAEAGSRFRAALSVGPEAVTMANLAAVCAHERKFAEAESLYRRALEILGDDPKAGKVRWNYAGTLRQAGRKGEAKKLEARVSPVPGFSVDVSSLRSPLY